MCKHRAGLVTGLLLLLLAPAQSWAFSYVATSTIDASSDGSALTSSTCVKPTGTVDGDIMFALVKRASSEAFNSVPTGWNSFGSPVFDDDAGSVVRHWLYWRVASSEGASYQWTWTTSGRAGCSIYTFRSDFNTSDPIDVISNTSYETSDTTARAASMTTTAANEAIVFFAMQHVSATQSCTGQPSAPTTLNEDSDQWNSGSRFMRCVSSAVWSGSGPTGNMDATLSNTIANKHAFSVALKPAAAGGGSLPPNGFGLLGVGR